ncbi:MAG: pantoate--beta-alanine ligase [Defluviitaleaceae bacterium]|nr:pantoate--beta-alanine ligase [Defluviitaleaceae bacterium]
MKVNYTIIEIREKIKDWNKQGLSVGFVPTMGYLHTGHLSLIEAAKRENDKVVVSIFVNPTQFSPNEDLEKYPRNFEKDKLLCEQNGVDILFFPTEQEIYPNKNLINIDINKLDNNLCGRLRIGHFNGVCLIVLKLFNIIKPTNAYFGKKDFQQLQIIKNMVKDFNIDINIIGMPIIREKNGLALSSRNSYLSKEEFEDASIINKSLQKAKYSLENGETDIKKIISNIENSILQKLTAKIDYIEIVDTKNLQKVDKIDCEVLISVAVFIGKTRLIDNIVIQNNM